MKKIKGKEKQKNILRVLVISTLLCVGVVSLAAQELPSPPPGDPFYIEFAVEPSELVADGSSTSTINASVWQWDSSFGEYLLIWNYPPVISFSTDLGSIPSSAPYVNGTATAILTTGTQAGTATITAEADLDEFGIVNGTTTVTFTAVGGDGGNGGGSSGGNGGTTSTPTPTVTTSPGITPTPTSTETPSPTSGATATPTQALTPGAPPGPTATPAPATPTPEEPGFGAAVAIAGLLAVAYLLMWRRDE
jgi:PGF-CTERM protein